MSDLVDINAEKKKRSQPCLYCGKREDHPGYSCPRIAILTIDEDGHVWQVEFHDWREQAGEDA